MFCTKAPPKAAVGGPLEVPHIMGEAEIERSNSAHPNIKFQVNQIILINLLIFGLDVLLF